MDASYVVLSSSMSPTIHAGDVVFVNEVEPSSIDEGDVITFDPESGPLADRGERITHRVIQVENRENGIYFKTKGDANNSPDSGLVAAENVVGKVGFHVPLIGHVISFAGTTMGIMTTIILPAVLLIVLEVRDLISTPAEDQSADNEMG